MGTQELLKHIEETRGKKFLNTVILFDATISLVSYLKSNKAPLNLIMEMREYSSLALTIVSDGDFEISDIEAHAALLRKEFNKENRNKTNLYTEH